jgi:8-oxo-dGTP pyrophosphatase MutT (NUDIX family)
MKQSGISNTLQQIYDQLPLYAEEGGVSSIVNTDSLVNELSDSNEVNALLMVQLVQRVFTLLGVLDTTILQHGIWRFVSFPASLLARSTLKSLADSDQSMFDSGFWNQQDSNSPVSDQQRNILHQIESQRQQHHKTNAQPVRYVHVAWGLIVVDGKVLLRHREDKNRTDLNNYVLVGGRVSQNDLIKANEELTSDEAIRSLQSPLASENTAAIEVALKREINEETGLDYRTHYSFTPWRTIKPYTAVEGAGANHALTEYRIYVHHIELTLDGILALAKNADNDKNLTWFTLDEFEQAKSVDGKMAYIDALTADYATPQAWKTAVSLLEPSYQSTYPLEQDNNAITLPQTIGQPLLYGKTGKEQKVDLVFTAEELSLLTSLCLYAKDSTSTLISDKIIALPNSWLEINDPEVQVALKDLAIKLRLANCPIIEGYKEQYYRMALAPENIYFDEAVFTYSLSNTGNKEKTELVISRNKLATDTSASFIADEITSASKILSNGLGVGLANIAKGIEIDISVMDTINKGVRRDLGSLCRSLGLRRMVRTINNIPTIAISLKQPLSES